MQFIYIVLMNIYILVPKLCLSENELEFYGAKKAIKLSQNEAKGYYVQF